MNEAPRIVGDEADGLGKLKSLLFKGEADRLKALEASVVALDTRVGTAPRFEAATAEVLVEALRRAEVARHRELAQAIAPVVVASIRNEIENSRETMVETLYPITGQMVVAAVANAIREALASINERLDRLTSTEHLKLRLRAALTGRSVAELALAGQTWPRLVRALFLDRASGALLASWRADGEAENRGELIGGLLAALSGFARDALGADGGDLRTLEFGGHDIYVHASPTHLIASETSAPLRAEQKQSLDRDCLAWLARYARNPQISDSTFGAFFSGALNEPEAPARRKGLGLPFKIVVACLALALLGFAARGALRAWRDSQLRGALAETVASRPALGAYPLSLTIDHGRARASLAGLAPTQADADALAASLSGANTGYDVAANVGVVATNASLADDRARADASLASLRADLAAIATRLDALTQASRDAQTRASGAASDMSQKLAAIEAGLSDLRARVEAPKARLAALIAGQAVFFDRDRPIDRPGLSDRLDAIADILKTTGLSLRVVGYTDDTGSDAINQSLSRHRAEVVADMLALRGVSKDHLPMIGRAAADPIAASTPGAREKNRRAAFEIPYDGEAAP